MPVANNPLLPGFYVYAFHVGGVPFYVGEGRSSRASDRVRYVRYQMRREAAGKTVKWCKNNRVIAECLKRGLEVELKYLHENLTREDALTREREEIGRLLSSGFALSNREGSTASVEQIVEAVVSRTA